MAYDAGSLVHPFLALMPKPASRFLGAAAGLISAVSSLVCEEAARIAACLRR